MHDAALICNRYRTLKVKGHYNAMALMMYNIVCAACDQILCSIQ